MTSPPPRNETVLLYAPGSPERASLRATLDEMQANAPHTVPLHIGGRSLDGHGDRISVTAPHRHSQTIVEAATATTDDVRAAVDAAIAAHHDWSTAPWETRAAVFLRAADLLSGPFRDRLNAATILGQSKSVHQSEIDAACELIDFWRWNVHFGEQLQATQPVSSAGHVEPHGSPAARRASCWRSAPSTSPRSAATSQPRPRSSATPSCGSRPPRRSSQRR
jgi:1-pyrroline-5-carboxylate dehydrogenase